MFIGGYHDDDIINANCFTLSELKTAGIDLTRYALIQLYLQCNGNQSTSSLALLQLLIVIIYDNNVRQLVESSNELVQYSTDRRVARDFPEWCKTNLQNRPEEQQFIRFDNIICIGSMS